MAYTFVGPDQGEPLTAIELVINKTIDSLPLDGFTACRRERRPTHFRELYSTAASRAAFGG